jgi:ATP-dependent RNA helicase RhlE
VNYDLPHVPEDYVHRIGRTGRAGSTGEALSLVCSEDRPLLGAIERLINKKIEVRTVEGFDRGDRPAQAQAHGDSERQRPPRESQPQQQRGPKREERGPKREERGPKREQQQRSSKREERAPRSGNAPPPRTSGNSGGMDFNKPYEPSTPAAAAEPAQDNTSGRKRPASPVPALFRRKAA